MSLHNRRMRVVRHKFVVADKLALKSSRNLAGNKKRQGEEKYDLLTYALSMDE
jgi:hypothetical protein